MVLSCYHVPCYNVIISVIDNGKGILIHYLCLHEGYKAELGACTYGA